MHQLIRNHRRQSGGFTLIELIIVVVLLGILVVIVAGQFSKGTMDTARSFSMYEGSKKLGTNWTLLAQMCGKPTTVTGSALPAAGKTALDVLVIGSSNLTTAYTGCYNQAALKPLTQVVQSNGSGGYLLQGHLVTMTDDSNGIKFSFSNVTTSEVTPLVQKYGDTSKLSADGTLAAATSDSANPVVQFTAEVSGERTMTLFIKP